MEGRGLHKLPEAARKWRKWEEDQGCRELPKNCGHGGRRGDAVGCRSDKNGRMRGAAVGCRKLPKIMCVYVCVCVCVPVCVLVCVGVCVCLRVYVFLDSNCALKAKQF